MSDSSDVDNALVAKLGADAALLAQMLNGVYFDKAPAAMTRFVLVSLVEAVDGRQFGGRAFEDALYLVKAVGRSTPDQPLEVGVMKTAAARIDALLEGGTLTVAGYTLMTMHRESRVRETEADEEDTSISWEHRGGHYRVMVST